VAATASDDTTSRSKGGDIGCAPRGRYDGAFEEAVWNQPVGVVGVPVRSPLGYHIILVTDRRERTFEEMLPALRGAVRDESQATLQAWLRDATRKASVAVDPGIGRWNATSGLVEPPGGPSTMGLVPGSGPTTTTPPTTGAPR
jgi:parvulin-like peptidyl-prolyl isomerase